MDSQAIKIYGDLERYYWWFLGRRRVIEKILSYFFKDAHLQIFDWGCGPGGNFLFLQKFGEVLGADASDEALESCRRQGITNIVKAVRLEEFSDSKKFDLITNFDVLEHLQDDEAFLREARRLLLPGGFILVTVPAYKFLWSELDDAVGHVRRYGRTELKEKFRRQGYEVLKVSYFMTFLSLPMIVYRLFGRLTGRTKKPKFSYVKFPRPINWLFTQVVYFEARLLKYINFPFGTSIILLAKKTDEK